MEEVVCELSLLTKTLDCPPHHFSFLQSGERVSMCRAASHAAVLLTPHRRPDLDPPQHSESHHISRVWIDQPLESFSARCRVLR